jgi:hypothetical protein
MNEPAAVAAVVDRTIEVAVIYNGVTRAIKVEENETIKQVLERAIQVFSPLPQPHTLALYTEVGKELDDAQTVRQAGIHPHEKLLLRPSQVKGG